MANLSKLRRARLAVGLSIDDLAQAVGVAVSTISTWENGVSSPSAKRIPKLAEALKVPPEAVLDMLSA